MALNIDDPARLLEAIEWFPVADRLPDDDRTVLICLPAFEHKVWIGWYEAGRPDVPAAFGTWRQVDAEEIETWHVTAWAELPVGPT